jgi:DNA-binding NarL/FixJ family response regulator
LIAAILPLAHSDRQNLGNLTAAIFVQDPAAMAPSTGEAFAKLHGLTASELRVLRALAPGLSIKKVAELLGIGETTVRTHLQHIYSKTGTSKQSELIHMFMSSTPPVETP